MIFKIKSMFDYRFKRRDRKFRRTLTAPTVPKRFTEFAKVTTFESQLDSLKTRGFLRALKGYEPPSDAAERFAAVCQEGVRRPLGAELAAAPHPDAGPRLPLTRGRPTRNCTRSRRKDVGKGEARLGREKNGQL